MLSRNARTFSGISWGIFASSVTMRSPVFLSGCKIWNDIIQIMTHIVKEWQINEARLNVSMTLDLFTTEEVYKFVAQWKPFRDAYQEVKKKLFSLE